jgi:hypothetical protein
MPFAHDSERSHQHEPVGVVFLEPSYIVIVALDLIQAPTGNALVGKLLIRQVGEPFDGEAA